MKIMTGGKLHTEIMARWPNKLSRRSHKDNLRPNLPVTLAIPPVTQGQFSRPLPSALQFSVN